MARKRVNAAPGPSGSKSGGDSPSSRDWIDPRRAGWLRPLLLFVPATILARLLGAPGPWLFVLSAVAIIPLAGLIGEATEELSDELGPGIGGLLNATFGNAAELIIALFALFKGLDGVVKASLTGSIIGNILLVLGASLLAGGMKHTVQRFNRTAAGVGSTMMVLAAFGMLVPAIFHGLVGTTGRPPRARAEPGRLRRPDADLRRNLIFSLVTHHDLYNPEGEEKHEDGPRRPAGDGPGRWRPAILLLAATGFVAWMSEILVGTVEAASEAVGMTQVFVGVIVVAIVGNAAEHSTAVWMAMKNRMDLAVGISLGSALQIALFVAPVLVFASYLRAEPMDLLFTPLEVAAVVLAVLIARMVAEDGESNWLEGAMLLMIYAILGMAFFFLPESVAEAAEGRPAGCTARRRRRAWAGRDGTGHDDAVPALSAAASCRRRGWCRSPCRRRSARSRSAPRMR